MLFFLKNMSDNHVNCILLIFTNDVIRSYLRPDNHSHEIFIEGFVLAYFDEIEYNDRRIIINGYRL